MNVSEERAASIFMVAQHPLYSVNRPGRRFVTLRLRKHISPKSRCQPTNLHCRLSCE